MSPIVGSRRRGVIAFLSAASTTLVVVLTLGFAAGPARASAPNVITRMAVSTAGGTAPVNSLPNTPSQSGPAGGRRYTPPAPGAASPAAGGDDNFTEAFDFAYGGTPPVNSGDGAPDETVQTLDLTLPPGLLDSLAAMRDFCTPAELGTMPTAAGAPGTGWLGDPADGNAGCPADSQIGELAGGVTALGLSLPISGNLYLMQPTAPADVAEIGVEVESGLGGGSWYRAQTATGSIQFALDDTGRPELQVALALPAQATLDAADSAATGLVPYTLRHLTQTINGLSAAGAPFQRWPTADAPTTGTANVSVQDNGGNDGAGNPTVAGQTVAGLTGSSSATIIPTGAASLPYAPQLSASVVRDAGDADVALTTTISQAAGEAASRAITLTLPAMLAPNLANSLHALCADPGAADAGCTPIGTVTAVSSLLPTPLSGSLYLSGTPSGVSLDIVIPAPFAITLHGAVDLINHTVTFPSVPDMSLTSLQVSIAGGPSGIYRTTCTTSANTGAIQGAFTGQNGATATSVGAFTIAGCPAPSAGIPAAPAPTAPVATPAPRRAVRPSVQARGTRFADPQGRLTVRVAGASGAASFTRLRISAPAGTRFDRHTLLRSVTVHGAHARSIALVHGRLVILLRRAASRMTVVIRRRALRVGPGLSRRLAAHRVRSLRVGVALLTTTGVTEVVRVPVRL